MLGQASIDNGIVFIVSVYDGIFKPLVIAVANKALSRLKMLGTVHLSMTAIM